MSRFDKYLPRDSLKPYIHSFGVSENEEEQTYKIVPSTSLVMGFQYKGRLSHLVHGAEAPLNPMGITGLQDRFTTFHNSSHIGTVLVYFTEIGAAAFFRIPIHELFAERIALDTFIASSVLEPLKEKLTEAVDDKQRIEAVESFLLTQLNESKPDYLVTFAVQQIRQSNGLIRIRQLAEDLNISQSPLEKRFRKVVGASPKKFATIIRFEALLKGYCSTKNLTEAAYMFGYYDQAHFIKDFKQFTGETPERFLLKK